MASQETEQKLNQHELRAKKEWESTYAKPQREEEMKMQALMALNDHELEQSRLTDLARITRTTRWPSSSPRTSIV